MIQRKKDFFRETQEHPNFEIRHLGIKVANFNFLKISKTILMIWERIQGPLVNNSRKKRKCSEKLHSIQIWKLVTSAPRYLISLFEALQNYF